MTNKYIPKKSKIYVHKSELFSSQETYLHDAVPAEKIYIDNRYINIYYYRIYICREIKKERGRELLGSVEMMTAVPEKSQLKSLRPLA